MGGIYYKCDKCHRIFPPFSHKDITLGKFEPFRFKPNFSVDFCDLHLCPTCFVEAVEEWFQSLEEGDKGGKLAKARKRGIKRGGVSHGQRKIEILTYLLPHSEGAKAKTISADLEIELTTTYTLLSRYANEGLLCKQKRDGAYVFQLSSEGQAQAANILTEARWLIEG